MGKNSQKMLKFAIKHPGWMSLAATVYDKRAAKSLERLGFLELKNKMFRLRPPSEYQSEEMV